MMGSSSDPGVNQVPSTEKSGSHSDSYGSADEEQIDTNGTAKSDVWPHFTRYNEPLVEVVDGVEKVVGNRQRCRCNYCGTTLACDSRGNGTSTLRKHIEIVCKSYPGTVNIEEGGQQMLTKNSIMVDGVKMLGNTVWSREACTDAATRMIVIDELPFSFIENTGFKHFCDVAIPKWEPPTRKVIVKNFLKMYAAKKAELKSELQSRSVCLTTDTWTSCQNINYMVITAHFIDHAWKMHKRVLNFCVISNHNGTTIGKILENALLEWGIENVLTISVDNASSNKVAIDYLRTQMEDWDKRPLLGGRFMHVRCLPHIVNLIVRYGLNLMNKSVAAIRNAVMYVRSSPARMDVFKSCVEKTKLECKKICILDVQTRWNSTYLMLDTALELRRAFDRMASEDSKYRSYFDEDDAEDEGDEESQEAERALAPTRSRASKKRVGPPKATDWASAEVFVSFLRVFYQVTVNVSSQLKPTAQLAFHDIVSIKAEINELYEKPIDEQFSTTDLLLYDMAKKMKKKYSKYFDKVDDINELFLVALVLDPRYKLKYLERNFEKMLDMNRVEVKRRSDCVKDLLVSLCDAYSQNTVSHTSQKSRTESSEGTSQRTRRNICGKKKDMLEDWNRQLEEGEQMVVGSEIDRYLLDPIEKPNDHVEFKILDWWARNGNKYPTLAIVARDVLAIQVSTVASESSFSTGKRVIDPHRSSMTPKTVEALICLQNWLKSDSVMGLSYLPTVEEIEFYEDVEKNNLNKKEISFENFRKRLLVSNQQVIQSAEK
ncbi:hypothetical protein OROMI_029716 [Orobanche minor]